MDKEGVYVQYTDDSIAILTMNNGENRINISFLKSVNAALDEVESNKNCRGLITTGNGKFYSNGLDLAWIQQQKPEEFNAFRKYHTQTVRRITHFPMPTVAAINGHAFAAGAFFAMAHDYRVMRTDRGWISWNETLNKLRFPEDSLEFMRAKIKNARTKRDAIIFAKRYTAKEAKEYELIDAEVELPNLLPEAKRLVNKALGPSGIDREMLATMKRDVYGISKPQSSKL